MYVNCMLKVLLILLLFIGFETLQYILIVHILVFGSLHESYAQKIKECTTGEEEGMNHTMRECNVYLKEVE